MLFNGKTYTFDSISHKRCVNNGQEDKYYIKDHHEPIIAREDFQKAKDILNSRNATRLTGRRVVVKKFTFSGRFRCGFCGHSYCKKSLYKKRPAWDCISVAQKGREYCPESKIIHEDVIKSVFMEAYYLMSANRGLAIEKFINNLKESTRDAQPQIMKAKIENEIVSYKNKLSKLVDLFVDEKVDQITFEAKQKSIQDKIERCEQKLTHLKAVVADDDKVVLGFNKIKNEILIRESQNEIKDFDENLFEALVDYGIIGGYDELGNKNNYLIRFICKKGFNLRPREDINEDIIVQNNKLGDEDSIYMPIIDFVSNQNFFVFEKLESRMKKTLITKVRVRVEIEK